MRKLINSIVLLFAVALIITLCATGTIETRAESADTYVYLSSTYTTGTDSAGHKYYQPDSNGYVYFTINLAGSISQDVTVEVTYRTENLSAVAEAGDYTKSSGTVTLRSNSRSSKVKVKTNTKGFTVNSERRLFLFRITNAVASDNSYVDYKTNTVELYGSIKCSLNESTESFNSNSGGTYNILKEYKKYEQINIDSSYCYPGSEKALYLYSWWHRRSFTISSNRYSKYISTGFADLYFGGHFYVDDDNCFLDGDATCRVSIDTTYDGTYNPPHGVYRFEDDDCFDEEIMRIGNEGGDESYRGKVNTTVQGGCRTYSQYIYATTSSRTYYFTFCMEDADDGDIYSVDIEDVLVDSKRPTITGWYVTSENNTINDNIRISVRFSEPVQNAQNTKLVVALDQSDKHEATFDYLMGNGTDTLVYTCKASSLVTNDTKYVNSTELYPRYIKNAGNITDYGLNSTLTTNSINNPNNSYASDPSPSTKYTCFSNDRVDPTSLKTPLKINLDLRQPTITCNKTFGSTISSSKSINVTVSDVSDDATLWYIWTDSTDVPSYYDSSITNTDFSKEVTITCDGVNGIMYLHMKCISKFGRSCDDVIVGGPAYFDSTAPRITDYTASENFREKDFCFTLTDTPVEAKSGVQEVYMIYTTNINHMKKATQDGILDGAVTKLKVYDAAATSNILTYDSVTGAATMHRTTADMGLENGDYATFYIAFSAVDATGNVINIKDYQFLTCQFDTRSLFDSTYADLTCDSLIDPLENDNIRAYDAKDNVIFTITKDEADGIAPFVSTLKRNGVDIPVSEFATTSEIGTTNKGLRFTCNDNLQGYYELILQYNTKFSTTYKFYFGTDLDDSTINYEELFNGNSGVLRNYVFQLSSSLYYYKNNLDAVTKENYGGVAKLPTFSSDSVARDYVKYMELQDLYLYKIENDAIANALNNGTVAGKTLAQGEKAIAAEGDYYIRYKKATWNFGEDTDNWVYYRLGSNSEVLSETINTDSFLTKNKNLEDAINAVVTTIINAGSYTFLTDSDLDSNGEPILDVKQYHYLAESASQSKSGSIYSGTIQFAGDTEIYSSYIKYIDNKDYRLASNYLFQFENSKIFYGLEGSNYIEMFENRNRLRTLVNNSGVYNIMEMDYNGIHVYKVYVDCDAPKVNVTFLTNDDQVKSQVFDSDFNNTTFAAKNIVFTEILGELDEFAYIAVYKVTPVSQSLLTVFKKSDIDGGLAELESGDYTLMFYDRSGNTYTVNIRVNSESLEVNIAEVENEYIRITCNRLEDEIRIYEIYCDNELLVSQYVDKATFKESGLYRIYIVDWYGNVYNKEYDFTRHVPAVSIKYINGLVTYVYDEKNPRDGLVVNKIDSQTMNIYTNGNLAFLYPIGTDYVFNFDGYTPETNRSVSGTNTQMLVTATESYKLIISYSEFPNSQLVIDVTFDNESPVISVSLNDYEYGQDEWNELRKYQEDVGNGMIDLKPNGERCIPSSIGYAIDDDGTIPHYISDGSIVSSKLIDISFFDASPVTKCEIYIDDVLWKKEEDINGLSNIQVSKGGHYKIIAYDIMGNGFQFEFYNMFNDRAKATIDEKTIEADVLAYGHEAFKFYTKNEGYVSFLIEGDKTYFYFFYIYGNELYLCEFFYSDSIEDRYIKEIDTLVYDESSKAPYNFGLVDGQNFTVSKVGEEFVFVLSATGSETYEIYAKFNDDETTPYYVSGILSKKKSDVGLTNTTTEVMIETNQEESAICVAEGFTVNKPNNDVINVEISYSLTFDFMDYELLFNKDNDYYKPNGYIEEGNYRVVITNIYGNETIYIVCISRQFNVVKTALFSDNTTCSYTNEYESAIYSNHEIKIIAYSKEVSAVVYKGDIIYHALFDQYETYGVVTLNEVGSYKVYVTDGYGNEVVVYAYINSLDLKFNEKLLYGYNEKAKLRSEGYTNKKLSVDIDETIASEIYFMSVIYDNEEHVLFDSISENKVLFDLEKVSNYVGSLGAGVYEVVIRDVYGNKASKIIHYAEESSLLLSRTTRSQTTYEDYSLDKAIKEGFYSNNTLRFTSTSSNYTFTINNEPQSLEKTLGFEQGVEVGYVSYKIYYLDEYGFEYSFEAILYRGVVEVQATDPTIFVEIGQYLTTNKNFTVEFTENATCTYIIDKVEYDYKRGQLITTDGIYRFTVTDFAGNFTSITYKKDSICDFTFTDTLGAKILINGGVSNNNKVQFQPRNGDSSYIEEVYRNGEKLTEFYDEFNESGHYEVLIKDEVGNVSFFEFTIIANALKEFEYQTPYTYKVTDVKYTTDEGGTISLLDYVYQTDDNSYFSFEDDGQYQITMYSTIAGIYDTFGFIINKVAPTVKLVGCEEGEATLNDITIEGCEVGDVVYLYKDGELQKTYKITSEDSQLPVVSTGGEYVIKIVNAAGIEQELQFTRIHVANAAGSALIIISVVVFNVVLFIGIVYRTKSKVDK